MSHKSWMKTVPTENCDVLMTFPGALNLSRALALIFSLTFIPLFYFTSIKPKKATRDLRHIYELGH